MIFNTLSFLAVSAAVFAMPIAEPAPAVAYKTVDLPPVYVTRNTVQGPVKYVTSTGPMQYSTAFPTPTTTSTPATSPTGSTGELVMVPAELVYSPYNNDQSCKDAQTIANDIYYLHSKGIKSLRIYATDCDSLTAALPVVNTLGMQVTQGTWIDADGIDSGDYQLAAIIAYGQANGWNGFRRILIGNEGISNGWYTAQQIADKINDSRSQLRAAGYNGPVSTAEIVSSYQNSAALCDAVDFAGANIYSYFTTTVTPADAGPFVKSQAELVSQACPGKSVSITETGYPHCGDTNGDNVPSTQNQIIALNSILTAMDGDVTILTPWDDLWKSPGPYGVEQCFGMINLL